MKLLIDKRPFSWTADYDIFDEDGSFAYRVTTENDEKNKTNTIFVASQYGGEVGKVVQKKGLFKTRYEIFLGDEPMGTVKKESMYGVTRYVLNYAKWRIYGTITNWEYDIMDDKYIVAHAGDENGEYPGKFVLNTDYSNNEVPILLSALAMEAATASHKQAKLARKA